MAGDAREFDLEEANSLVPRLTLEFARLARLREEIAILAKDLGGAEAAVAFLEKTRQPEANEVRSVEQLRALADDVNRTLERVHELGCVVKDVELGLVDFYGTVEGKRVFLCWQFGEGAVRYFHGLDEGFSERRPLLLDDDGEGIPARWVN
jgi:hypothetical protein